MRKSIAVLLSLLFVVVGLSWWFLPPDTEKGQPLDSAKSLWFASDVPQVGAIVRLSFADKKHKWVTSVTYLNATLSESYHPVSGATGDENLTLTNKASISLGAQYLASGGPSGAAKVGAARALNLKVRGERVLQWRSLDDLQNFVRQFDGRSAPSPEIHSLFAKINSAGEDERRTKSVTPYWIITKVFTGNSVVYSTHNSSGVTTDVSCGQPSIPCVIPALKLTANLDLSKDRQNVVSGSERPIFVVIKPLSTNTNGMIYINENTKGPGVIND